MDKRNAATTNIWCGSENHHYDALPTPGSDSPRINDRTMGHENKRDSAQGRRATAKPTVPSVLYTKGRGGMRANVNIAEVQTTQNHDADGGAK